MASTDFAPAPSAPLAAKPQSSSTSAATSSSVARSRRTTLPSSVTSNSTNTNTSVRHVAPSSASSSSSSGNSFGAALGMSGLVGGLNSFGFPGIGGGEDEVTAAASKLAATVLAASNNSSSKSGYASPPLSASDIHDGILRASSSGSNSSNNSTQPFALVPVSLKPTMNFLGTCNMLIGQHSIPDVSFFVSRPSLASSPTDTPSPDTSSNLPASPAASTAGSDNGADSSLSIAPTAIPVPRRGSLFDMLSSHSSSSACTGSHVAGGVGISSLGNSGSATPRILTTIKHDYSSISVAFAFKDSPDAFYRFPRDCLVEPNNVDAPYRLTVTLNHYGLNCLLMGPIANGDPSSLRLTDSKIMLTNVSQALCDALLATTFDAATAAITSTQAHARNLLNSSKHLAYLGNRHYNYCAFNGSQRLGGDLWLSSEMPQSLVDDINMSRQFAMTPMSEYGGASIATPIMARSGSHNLTGTTKALTDVSRKSFTSPRNRQAGYAAVDMPTAADQHHETPVKPMPQHQKRPRSPSTSSVDEDVPLAKSRMPQPQQQRQPAQARTAGRPSAFKIVAPPPLHVSAESASAEGTTSKSTQPRKLPSRTDPLNDLASSNGGHGNAENSVSTTPVPASAPAAAAQTTPATSAKRCEYCQSRNTPMWRRGPNGAGTLCNACGVKWKNGKILVGVSSGTKATTAATTTAAAAAAAASTDIIEGKRRQDSSESTTTATTTTNKRRRNTPVSKPANSDNDDDEDYQEPSSSSTTSRRTATASTASTTASAGNV
ncbi:hypothetical protein GQ42DRAFT_151982 [Ramicandelaber brevisporus]|nr:hypothetical protein GQ42DRAFT_151982 [Ramicandelaber brevisporus]